MEKIGLSEKQLLRYHETANFHVCRDVMAWIGHHIVIHFSIINFYISMDPVYY